MAEDMRERDFLISGQFGGRKDSLEGERTVWREKGQFGGRKDSLEGERTVWWEKGQFLQIQNSLRSWREH